MQINCKLSPYLQKMIEHDQKMQEAREAEQKEKERRYKQYRYATSCREDNIRLFLEMEGLYVLDPEGRISSQELYDIYKAWCLSQRIPLRPPREFWLHLKKNGSSYCLVYSSHIPTEDGRRVRGFRGIRALTPEEAAAFPDGPVWKHWNS